MIWRAYCTMVTFSGVHIHCSETTLFAWFWRGSVIFHQGSMAVSELTSIRKKEPSPLRAYSAPLDNPTKTYAARFLWTGVVL